VSDPQNTSEFDRMSAAAAATRAQLFDTLDAIEDKLNLPKQLGIAASDLRRKIDKNPVPYLAALAGGVLTVGGIVVSVLRRR
jgi:hypothetical protein